MTGTTEGLNMCGSDRRRPTNWSALEALELLSPPSPTPSLSTCALSSLYSSGEIPIYLDAGLVESISFDLPSSGSTEHLHPTSPALSDAHATSRTAPSSQAVFSPSFYSLEAVAHGSQIDVSQSTQPSGKYYDRHQTDDPVEYYLTISAHEASPSSYEDRPFATPTGSAWPSPAVSPRTSPACSTTTSPMGSPHSPKFLGSGSLYGCLSPISTDNVFDSGASLGPYYRSSSYSTLSTALFGSGTLSPSPSTGANHLTKIVPSLSFSKRLPKSGSCSPLAEDRQRPRVADSKEPNSEVVTPTVPTFEPALTRTESSRTMASVRSANSARSSGISSPLTSPSSKTPSLPGLLGWLRDISLDLWIDQDSSKAIRARFKLNGYTSEPSENRDVELINALTYGTADFRPVGRRSFVVHCRNADSSPVLRRLTVTGDDSKDYISRQASLTIESNGMYFVGGMESFPLQSPTGYSQSQPRREPLKLHWRFEYLVRDCSEGTPVAGEKAFTPLSFSCSPGLLHPTHGKKMKLMQTMKRNLAAKLLAEKMRVPRPFMRLDLTAGQGDERVDALRQIVGFPQAQGPAREGRYFSAPEDLTHDSVGMRASVASTRYPF
ncbi:hypothetical protein B0H21DRAFT_888611 [Amylocystis lapponica]|nr:hypothetical protein B0H21DRAFT_888611 [Amylocystis lapponica]